MLVVVVCCWLCAVRCSSVFGVACCYMCLFAVCLWVVGCWLLVAGRWLLFVVCGSLSGACCLLCVGRCCLLLACVCLRFVVCYWLIAVRCLLFAICR